MTRRSVCSSPKQHNSFTTCFSSRLHFFNNNNKKSKNKGETVTKNKNNLNKNKTIRNYFITILFAFLK